NPQSRRERSDRFPIFQPGTSFAVRQESCCNLIYCMARSRRDRPRAFEFRQEFVEGWEVAVTFDHRRDRSEASAGLIVERPDFFANRLIMRIDLVRLRLRMSGKMELGHSIDRNGVDVTRP